MKRLMCVAGMVLALIGIPAKAEDGILTLDACRQMAITKNKTLDQQRAKVEMAGYDRRIAAANFFPKVTATGLYQHTGGEFSLVDEEKIPDIKGESAQLQAEYNAANARGGLGRTLGITNVYKQVRVFDKNGVGKENLGPALDALVALQRNEASVRQGVANDAAILGSLYNPQAPLPCFDINAVSNLNARSLALMNEADACDISGNARCILASKQVI